MKNIYPILFCCCFIPVLHTLAGAGTAARSTDSTVFSGSLHSTDFLPAEKINFSKINELQIAKYNPPGARMGTAGANRLFVLKLFRGPNKGKNGKHGKPGFKLFINIAALTLGDSTILKVTVTHQQKKKTITDNYYVNPRYGRLSILSNGANGGDGGEGQDGFSQDAKHYATSGADGGNGGNGGAPGTFQVVYEPSAREYTNNKCIQFTSYSGIPGIGGKGGEAGRATMDTPPGVEANRGRDGQPGEGGGIGQPVYVAQPAIKRDTLVLFDSARNRSIPVAYYAPGNKPDGNGCSLVILSHGYNENRPGSYLGYAYIGEKLATMGYFVVSIQHELPTDSLIPMTGTPQLVRRPFWDRGADNILFVVNYLKATKPGLQFDHIALIGHSNGADMSALFPQKHPGIVEKIITLDNRRMPLPRTRSPRVYSLRSSDQPADDGVLPTEQEQKENNITIIKLYDVLHNDMGAHADPDQQKEINGYILQWLKEKL